jgi:hypothetical protein
VVSIAGGVAVPGLPLVGVGLMLFRRLGSHTSILSTLVQQLNQRVPQRGPTAKLPDDHDSSSLPQPRPAPVAGQPSCGPDTASPTCRPVPIVVQAEPAGAVIYPERTFTQVETDITAKALDWALDQVVRKFPGSEGTAETIQSLVSQYRSGIRLGEKGA